MKNNEIKDSLFQLFQDNKEEFHDNGFSDQIKARLSSFESISLFPYFLGLIIFAAFALVFIDLEAWKYFSNIPTIFHKITSELTIIGEQVTLSKKALTHNILLFYEIILSFFILLIFFFIQKNRHKINN